jgi:hypothetical protein
MAVAGAGVPAMTEPHVMRNYFAQWQRKSTNRWSRIHWFRDGQPACGAPDPGDDEKAFHLPPEPILTCRKCQRANEASVSS